MAPLHDRARSASPRPDLFIFGHARRQNPAPVWIDLRRSSRAKRTRLTANSWLLTGSAFEQRIQFVRANAVHDKCLAGIGEFPEEKLAAPGPVRVHGVYQFQPRHFIKMFYVRNRSEQLARLTIQIHACHHGHPRFPTLLPWACGCSASSACSRPSRDGAMSGKDEIGFVRVIRIERAHGSVLEWTRGKLRIA